MMCRYYGWSHKITGITLNNYYFNTLISNFLNLEKPKKICEAIILLSTKHSTLIEFVADI